MSDREVRVLFRREGETWWLRLQASATTAPNPPVPFETLLAEEEYKDLRWYLEDFLDLPAGGALVRARRIEQALDTWQKKLYAALFGPEDSGDRRAEIFDGEPPRLLTILSSEPEILRIPWELLSGTEGPTARHGLIVRRQLEAAEKLVDWRAGKRLRILLVVSRPADQVFQDPRNTAKALLDAVEPRGSDVVVDFCRPPTLARLQEMLARPRESEPYQIVHFDGHGDFLPDRETSILCFEQETGGEASITDPVLPARLARLMHTCRIPLVILEACRTGEIGRIDAFRSIAPALLQAGVGSVLTMSYAVHLAATERLLRRFYQGLVEGATISEALEAGRETLKKERGRWIEPGPQGREITLQDWFVPCLYQQGGDPCLVRARPARGRPRRRGSPAIHRPPAQGEQPGAFPASPAHEFQGRAIELHRLERAFRSHRAILLHGMGGMGKTSLAREAAFWWTRTGLFPDGACFSSFEQGGGADQIIQILGTYLEGDAFSKLPIARRSLRAQQLFRERAVLMVWDNFESTLATFEAGEALFSEEERSRVRELFRSWTEDAGRGRLLITCRPEEAGLPDVWEMELSGLARTESLHLLTRVLRDNQIPLDAERSSHASLEAVLDLISDHPLSIELIGPFLREMTPKEIQADLERIVASLHGPAGLERNRSLYASLTFSTRRLSARARAALTWLVQFQGGVFEEVLLRIARLDPPSWHAVRHEFEARALIRSERVAGDWIYLRLHPTLPYAGPALGLLPLQRTEIESFASTYHEFRYKVDSLLRGSAPHVAMEVLRREEANLRRAVKWALDLEAYDGAADIAKTYQDYLERSGRIREWGSWAAWLAAEIRKGGFTRGAAKQERSLARALARQGRPEEVIRRLESLLEELRGTNDFDPTFELAETLDTLGRMYDNAGYREKAVTMLKSAIELWKQLTESAKTERDIAIRRANLSAAFGSLSNALRHAHRLQEALEAARLGHQIKEDLKDEREMAAGWLQIADVLMAMRRIPEAEGPCRKALAGARRAEDTHLETLALQRMADLARHKGQTEKAAELYKKAIQSAEKSGEVETLMYGCNWLGALEKSLGRLPEARAWLARSREIAGERDDRTAVSDATLNLATTWKAEGKNARARGDEAQARKCFEKSLAFLTEALRIDEEGEDEAALAATHSELADIHRLRGELDKAEEHGLRAAEIDERLGVADVYIDYATLSQIASERGDAPQAEEWRRRHDAAILEIGCRAWGLPPEARQSFVSMVLTVAAACARSGIEGSEPALEVWQDLSRISGLPMPLGSLAPFLRSLAAGDPSAVPSGLPLEIWERLHELRAELMAPPPASSS